MRGFIVGVVAWGIAGVAMAQGVEAKFEGYTYSPKRLAIRFPDSMQAMDNQDVSRLVHITPATPMSGCTWTDDTQVSCSFSTALPLATPYRIALAPSLLHTTTGRTLPATPMVVETARPRVSANIAGWKAGRPRILVTSEFRIPVDALRAALRLSIDGKRFPVVLEKPSTSSYQKTAFQLVLPDSARESVLTLSVVPGLRALDGPLPGTQDATLVRAVTDEPFQVRGLACAGAKTPMAAQVREARLAIDGCTPDEAIRLFFSRELDQDEFNAWVATWPVAAKRQTSGSESWWRQSSDKPQRAGGWWVEFRIAAPHADVTLPVPALHAKDGAALKPITARVATGAPRPALVAPYDRALLLPGASSQMQVVNVPSQSLRIAGMAKDFRSEVIQTPAAGETPVPVTSTLVDRTLREGGIVSWSLQENPGDAALAAAPDFDVYAVSGNREVVVWTQTWEDGAPIAGANVELLLQRTRGAAVERIANARTDADGKAMLVLPVDFALPRSKDQEDSKAPQWIIRAEHDAHGKKRAVLPLDFGMRELGTSHGSGFGVSDRPLYRAGDTVHWRLWVRERRGTQLRAPHNPGPLKLTLAAEDYGSSDLLEWEATPAADGSITGDTVIPIHTPDGDYCVSADDGDGDASACFFVGTFRAQDLWMRASAPARTVRDGDVVGLDIEAGYYSGGTAAGAAIDRIAADVREDTIDQAYPQWKGYAFARGTEAWESFELAGTDELHITADTEGRARVPLRVAFEPGEALPPFGKLRITSEVKLSDRESTTSNPVELHYARFERYVGLKLEPAWLSSTSTVSMQGVVVDAEGREVTTGPIAVEVFYSEEIKGARTRIHACTLKPATETTCAFDRANTGYYHVVARQGDAAPAEITQYVWASRTRADETKAAKLEVMDTESVAGTPARLLLMQPKATPVLLVSMSEGAILDARIVQAAAGTQAITLPTGTHWPRNVSVRAYYRGSAGDAVLPEGFRRPVPMTSLSVELELESASRTDTPVTARFEPPQVAPAQTVRLVLQNTTQAPRNVTLAVVDDALRALGAKYVRAMDPANAELFEGSAWASINAQGFSGWNATRLRWLIRLPAEKVDDILCGEGRNASDCNITVVGNARVNPIDVSSVESTSILTAEQFDRLPLGRDTTSVALLAPGTARGRSQAFGYAAAADEGGGLDAVSVVGAPASADDEVVVTGADVPEPSSAPSQPDRIRALDLARVRTHFAETALWRTDIVLAPGESRTIEFTAPDNLTRWRAVAWNDDGASDFAMAEATLEAGLPVEARLQAPVRIYPGDRARLAVNVRHIATQAAEARASLSVQRGTDVVPHPATLSLPAQGQSSFGVQFTPEQPGQVLLTAAAATNAGQDAVALPLEVASTTIAAQRTQAGWIQASPLSLALPTLPQGASDARLAVSLWRGNDALVHGWTDDLRDYPHRCWEQILSRAVAAALALDRQDPSWPDAKAVVQEAIDNAAVFQDVEGNMRFFAQEPAFDEGWHAPPQIPLTVWTIDAFELLQSLGYAMPAQVEKQARAFLAGMDMKNGKKMANERAIVAGVVAETPETLAAIWSDFPTLALPARVSAARALARTGNAHAGDAIRALLGNAPQRAGARVLTYDGGGERWMSSPMREQCELIRLLQDFPQFAPAGARTELVAGLSDLYAGGVPQVDTQTGASCLRALRGERANDASTVAVDATMGAQTQQLALRSGEVRTEASFDGKPTGTLSIAAVEAPSSPVAYLARVDYNEDARHAQSNAIGFGLTRKYEVLRAHKWVPLGDVPLRDGDWVRITLTVTNARPRWFVAVTDDLPGGLRPMDLSLAGVAGVDVQALGALGDWAFDQRKLDPSKPKFYAERLPPGQHEIRYFARVANSGDYLAAPAVAESMYGTSTRARTAADRVRIADPAQ